LPWTPWELALRSEHHPRLASRVQGECVDVIMVCEKRKDGEYSVTCKWELIFPV
jgi:hypothetical protein